MKKFFQYIKKHSLRVFFSEIIYPYVLSLYYRVKKKELKLYSIKVKSNRLKFDMLLEISGISKIPMIDSLLLRRLGIYEPKTSKFLQEVLRPGFVVVELGAAFGYFTIQMSKLVGNKGVIHSFEPNKVHFNILNKNIQLNKLRNVVTYNRGVGKKSEVFIDGSNLKFETKAISESFKKVKKIDFIFIDIDAKNKNGENARQELYVIKDLINWCKSRDLMPIYFLEYIEKDEDLNNIFDLIKRHGYSSEMITDRHYYFFPT